MKEIKLKLAKKPLFRLILSASSGVLMAISWPPSSLNFLMLFSLVPLMLSFYSSPSWKSALLNSYLTFFIFSNYTMSWFPLITDEPKALVLIYLAHILIPLTQSLPWLISWWIMKRKGLIIALFSLPFFYLSYEIAHYHWDLTYTWIHLGLGLSNAPYFLKLYPFIGQEGGSFYILLCNMILAFLLLVAGGIKKQITEVICLSVLLTIPAFLPHSESTFNGNKKVAIFQPVNPYNEIITNESIESNFRALEKSLEQLDSNEVDVVICPEGYFKNYHTNPIIINDPSRHSVVQKLLALSRKKNAAIISGVIVVKLYYTNKAPSVSAKLKKKGMYYDTYNAVMLIEPNGNIQWRSKVKLVPFAERVPFLSFFNSLEFLHLDFNQSLGSYDFEHNPRPFQYQDMTIAPLVCYESLYPDVTSLFIDRRANIIMEFSNENWTKDINKGQTQHESYAKINAVQFGRTYIRSTFKNGSGIIQANGQPLNAIENSGNLLIYSVNLSSNKTFYTKNRSLWLVAIIIAIALFIVTLTNMHRKTVE